ncbi:response regulator transcription factor [Phycicoccus sp. BSK3Z-2]|uniref:Response regulator transcription factor n=1 Tax=Phycicoccus avicenniae TaxID=2828860 RepID=A0A941D8Q7_9MICO|nr:response regulator transcription factor [Phycicoccus avicenniae]MBR7744179.1 response regulator transcription factor [Phycicoccus avicenniae]
MFSLPCDVVAVDNLDVIRMGLTSLQLTHPSVVRRISTFQHAGEIDTDASPPDVVVLDYWLGREDDASIRYITDLKRWSGCVVLYTSEEGPARLRDCIRAGVDGLSLKNDGLTELAQVITEVAGGRPGWSGPLARAVVRDEIVMADLTAEEIKVLNALAGGLTVKEIASHLHKSPGTVGSQIESIRARYVGLTGHRVNRVKMLREGSRDGYIDPPRAKDTGNA